jgi:hypothetical protein
VIVGAIRPQEQMDPRCGHFGEQSVLARADAGAKRRANA